MTKENLLKKCLSAIIMVSILFSGIFFLPAKKAEAFWGVEDITFDPTNWVENAYSAYVEGEDWYKEYILDPLAWFAAKYAISAMTQSIVNWINSGFEGNPTFVQNPQQFLSDAANQASGVFIQQLGLTQLCSADWLPKLKLALQYNVPYTQRMQCTLTGVAENFEDNLKRFEDSFMNGGWDSWLSMTSNPQNNIWGAYFESSDELARRQAEAKENAKTEASWGQGFISLKKCVGASQETYCDNTCAHLEFTDDFDDCFNNCQDIQGVNFSSSDYCEQSGGTKQNTTPGAIIADQLKINLGSSVRQMELADEISEALSAIFNALINQLINKGLSSLSDDSDSSNWQNTSTSSDSIYTNKTAYLEYINKVVVYETQYRDFKQASVDAYNKTINKLKLLKTCYQNQNPVNQTKINEVQARIDDYEGKKTSLQTEADNSNALITDAEALKTEISNASTSAELTSLLNKFTNEIKPKMHTSADVLTAQSENETIKSELNAENSEIDAEYNLCLSGV